VTEAVKISSSLKSANASLSVSYSNVNWDFLKVVYGWAAVQYQAWARGELIIGGSETQHVILHTDGILEFWVDDKHYFGGDYYTFRKAPPVLHLKPGSHKIDIRLVRDVRAFGGILEPTIDVVVDVQQVSGTLELAKSGILMADVVDGNLASAIGSVSLRNSGDDDIEIIEIHAANVSSPISYSGPSGGHQAVFSGHGIRMLTGDETSYLTTHGNISIVLVAGQTRPVVFNITLPSQNASSIAYNIIYRTTKDTEYSILQMTQDVIRRSMYRPHKVTFLHPGGMVSYAILRPPAKNATCRPAQTKLPVLLALHGAGLEADNSMVTSALDPVSDLCAWVLFPTGVTPWSGDDWHNWGFADVEAAIEAIPSWIETIGWTGPGVDIDRWIVTGHSNGGQGTWYALTHRPDKVLAGAPLSGYASIQKYVSYELWQPADPIRTSIVSASLNSYRHEMLMANAKGITIQQQHGEVDDNVPAYNSRFLAQQLYLAGAGSSYNEVPGHNHWWDGVMTTPELVDFYYAQTRSEDVLPRKLKDFTMVVGSPGDTGSKSGIKVLQLQDPGRYGRVEVKGHIIKTSNIMSLEFDPSMWKETVVINGAEVELGQLMANIEAPMKIYNIAADESYATSQEESTMTRRQERQLGSMTAILQTQGHFVIRHAGLASTSHVALQVSRNLHQYFQADAVILPSFADSELENTSGNIVTIAIADSLPNLSPYFPIRLGDTGCSVRDHQGHKQDYGDAARGAAFVRSAGVERLELVIWGADEEGLQQAARVVPMLTGVGQPDFVVFGASTKWRGIEGILAMGFFDAKWKVTASSLVETA
jgi:predicted esterase